MVRETFLKMGKNDARGVSEQAQKLQMLSERINSFGDAVKALMVLDGYGCADRWLGLVVEEWDAMVDRFVALKSDVDAFVDQQPDLAAARQGEGLNGVKLLDDDVTTFLVEFLQRRRSAVVGAPVEAVTVMRDVIEALNDSALGGGDVDFRGEVVSEPAVDEGNHAADRTGAE